MPNHHSPQTPIIPDAAQKPVSSSINLWLLLADVGIKIAAPIIVGELLAIKVDKTLGTTPLFIIIALIGSFTLSIILLARDVTRINRFYDRKKNS